MKGCLKRVLLGIVVIVVVLVVIGIVVSAASGNHGATTPTSTGTSAPVSAPAATPPPAVGHIGTMISVPGNLDVTLTGTRLSTGDAFDTPKTGLEYVIATFRFHNPQSSSVDVANTGFKASSVGVSRNPEYLNPMTKNGLDMAGTSLNAGGTLSADVVFQIAKGQPATIIYTPDQFDTSKRAAWTVQG